MSSLTPQEFVAKWKHVDLKESASAQQHFLDICALIGHPTPAEADPTGQSFTFEAGADKVKGGQGRADVWKRGCFAWEYKGKHANLDKAYQQLLQYHESLDSPPLLIVSDIGHIVIHTKFINTVKRTETITLDDLLKPDKLALLRDAFNNPDALRIGITTAQVTQKAAAQFAQLAELLRKYGTDSQQIAHFLIRLLFCLFAEDIELLPNKLFSHLVKNTAKLPKAFVGQLGELFARMKDGGYFGSDLIPYVDGGLFDNATVLELDSDGLRVLMEAAALDWSSIEPSIFGALFERSLDPDKRSQLGAHYTSKEDILLVVEPVLMAPLRRRWAEVKARAHELAAQRDTAKGAQRTKLQKDIDKLLREFAEEIAHVQVLDPASGSGNFLYVALRQLLDLWKEIYSLLGELGSTFLAPTSDAAPYPTQLHGIEINPYAYELAQATIWIGYIQWMRENGFGFPSEPILRPMETIKHMDAILAYDANDQPVEPDWPQADVIIGNPPFLGDKKMRAELGDKYVDDLRALYADRLPGQSDLVCYWFEKTRAMIEIGSVKRAGLLATNSIRKGTNRAVLARIKATGEIFMAWSDREWILDGAAVRVSMVGFDDGLEQTYTLDSQAVSSINADLTSQADVTSAKSLSENENLCFLGMMKGGPFDIDDDTAQRMLKAPQNPNGMPNSDVIKRRLGAQDITGVSSNGWIIDFVEADLQEAAQYEMPFEYVRKVVKPVRNKSRDRRMREKWWLHGRPRPALREALRGLARCIVTPEVSKYRVFVWMSTNTIPDHTCHVIARDDDYFFGVLHSRVHEVWSLAVCNYIGSGNDPRYNSSKTFKTFPFPWPPGKEPKRDSRVKAIAQAARELAEQRETQRGGRTLTQLYNEHPTWLDLAHRKLDEAIFDAYGWPRGLSDEDILARLLALNLERAEIAAH